MRVARGLWEGQRVGCRGGGGAGGGGAESSEQVGEGHEAVGVAVETRVQSLEFLCKAMRCDQMRCDAKCVAYGRMRVVSYVEIVDWCAQNSGKLGISHSVMQSKEMDGEGEESSFCALLCSNVKCASQLSTAMDWTRLGCTALE